MQYSLSLGVTSGLSVQLDRVLPVLSVLTNTIAGRYGAICGFGLSLIKWILIVRVSLLVMNRYNKHSGVNT